MLCQTGAPIFPEKSVKMKKNLIHYGPSSFVADLV